MAAESETTSEAPRVGNPVTAATEIRIATQRFGLGPKPGVHGRLGSQVGAGKAAVLAELGNPGLATLTASGLPTYAAACRAGETSFDAAWKIAKAEVRARLTKQLVPEIGFLERLVLFWTNHFSISVNKAEICRATLGQLERDVIRRNVLGRFRDMLSGVMRHPAMVKYLDNEDSLGPASKIGLAWNRGYNENLAREILELHTLGVGGGYAQADVIGLAKALTGWSYVRGWESDGGWNGGNQGNRGQFIFRPDWHEPGPQTVLGRAYPDTGQGQAQAILDTLSVHPKTAEFIAFKLVQHFVADEPTPAMVTPVATAFRTSGGDLKATARALIDLPEAWAPTFKRIRTPYELTVAQYRALAVPLYTAGEEWRAYEPLRALNHMPGERQTPDGYPAESFYWLNPDAMRVREDTAFFFAYDNRANYRGPRAPDLARSLFGPALSSASLAAVTAQTEPVRGLATLLMTPEFQRR